jgi:hypothetical protein
MAKKRKAPTKAPTEETISKAVRRADRSRKAEGAGVGMLIGGLALFYVVMRVWSNWKKAHIADEVTI